MVNNRDTIPGPSDYKIKLDTCLLSHYKKPSIGRAKRWSEKTPTIDQMYNTGPAKELLLKRQPSNIFTRARRCSNPLNFHAKNVKAIKLGCTI
jgi:hypothetical protein